MMTWFAVRIAGRPDLITTAMPDRRLSAALFRDDCSSSGWIIWEAIQRLGHGGDVEAETLDRLPRSAGGEVNR